MDPITNPFAPGAGTPPPELAGRDELIKQAHVQVERGRRSLSSSMLLMIGLRGSGKTVLLDRLRKNALASGICIIRIEADERRSLPSVLAPELHRALLQLSRNKAARELAVRALRGLAGFVRAFKLKYQDIEVGITHQPEPGLADYGDLGGDLTALFKAAADAAAKAGTAVALFMDELQYVHGHELAALIEALHRAAQDQSPVTLVGAGLPSLRANVGKAKTYAERMFSFKQIGALTEDAARDAIKKPLAEHGVDIAAQALDLIFRQTECYPYFLQEWGKCAWNVAQRSPIRPADINAASAEAIAALDASFFQIRFDRLTPAERRYLRAMAELGAGPHQSGDIAALLGGGTSLFGTTRSNLIEKGMLWSPEYGKTAFTVPLFSGFMQRIMPSQDWQRG